MAGFSNLAERSSVCYLLQNFVAALLIDNDAVLSAWKNNRTEIFFDVSVFVDINIKKCNPQKEIRISWDVNVVQTGQITN